MVLTGRSTERRVPGRESNASIWARTAAAGWRNQVEPKQVEPKQVEQRQRRSEQGNLAEPSDDEWVGLVAKGDRIAFTRLVARHRTRLLALANRTLGNPASAEDVVQEVFIRAWMHAPTWQARDSGRASYAAWLSRVAVNLAIDQTRKVRSVAIDAIAEPEDPAVPADAAMIAAERAKRVRAAIAALPDRQRMALALTYDADLSNADGAEAMETSVGAFELLLVRARRALRLSLSDE